MGAVYLGNVTVGGSVPGLSAALATVGDALGALKAVTATQLAAVTQAQGDLSSAVATQLTLLGDIGVLLDAQGSALAAAKTAIRIPAVADFETQLSANVDIAADLGLQVSDPIGYVSGLLSGLLEVQQGLQAALVLPVPSVTITEQISASAAIGAALQLKIDAIDLKLGLLVPIGAAISTAFAAAVQIQAAIRAALDAALAALTAIRSALSTAINAALAALATYASMVAAMAATGVHCFLYTGPLSGLGAAIDGISVSSSGLAGGTSVRVPLVFCDASNAPAVSGINGVYKVA